MRFSFYGYDVDIEGSSEEITAEVARDFAWFVTNDTAKPADLRVTLCLDEPAWNRLPAIPASVITPRNVTFRNNGSTYIDYFSRGLAVLENSRGSCTMYSSDFDMLREMAYLFLLSTVGQHLDSQGLHRIHAMGVNHGGMGILLLLPSGGGKSTMTLELLKQPDFTLLSEDTPLIDSHGTMHPFPLRLGVRGSKSEAIPEKFQRTFNRMEFDPKTFVDIDFFRHKLSESVPVSMIFVGERNLGAVSGVTRLARRAAMTAILKYLIVGLGVYQGLEFLLEEGIWDMRRKLGMFTSRSRNGMSLLRRAPAYKLTLGRDTMLNSTTLMEFIRQQDNT
ncbi:MAG TPA: hypothetical protein VF042_02290 [Gemmatimonadaceae bacterium]